MGIDQSCNITDDDIIVFDEKPRYTINQQHVQHLSNFNTMGEKKKY